MLEGIKSFFEDKDEDLPSDDEEVDESNIAQVLNKVVNKSDNNELMIKDDDNTSEMSDKEMYHLKILKDESDNEGSEDEEENKDDNKKEQNDDDNISFFD